MQPYKVFVSHGSHDAWLALQIAKEIQAVGATTFLDETNIPKGAPDLKKIIRNEIWASRELLALFTPWSVMRSWVWIEMGPLGISRCRSSPCSMAWTPTTSTRRDKANPSWMGSTSFD